MILVIDGPSNFASCFFAEFKDDDSSLPGVFSTISRLMALLYSYEPTELVVCWDSATSWRRDRYPLYKTTRVPKPPNYYTNSTITKNLLSRVARVVEVKGYEADDLIATACKLPGQKVVATGDKDMLALVGQPGVIVELRRSRKTDQIDPETGKNTWETIVDRFTDPLEVRLDYGVYPHQMRFLKALAGESSDNIPHPEGVGEVAAKRIIEIGYESLDVLYSMLESPIDPNEIDDLRKARLLKKDYTKAALWEKLIAGKELAYLGYELAGLSIVDADVEPGPVPQALDVMRAVDALKKEYMISD